MIFSMIAPKALLQGAKSLTKYRFAILRLCLCLSLCLSVRFVRLFEALEKVCAIEQSLRKLKSECTLDDIKRFCDHYERATDQFGGSCSGVAWSKGNC